MAATAWWTGVRASVCTLATRRWSAQPPRRSVMTERQHIDLRRCRRRCRRMRRFGWGGRAQRVIGRRVRRRRSSWPALARVGPTIRHNISPKRQTSKARVRASQRRPTRDDAMAPPPHRSLGPDHAKRVLPKAVGVYDPMRAAPGTGAKPRTTRHLGRSYGLSRSGPARCGGPDLSVSRGLRHRWLPCRVESRARGGANRGASELRSLQATDLHEDRSTVDRLAGGVEFVSVEPGPTVVGGPIVHADNAEQHGRRELNARFSGHTDDIAGPGYQPDSLAVGKVQPRCALCELDSL